MLHSFISHVWHIYVGVWKEEQMWNGVHSPSAYPLYSRSPVCGLELVLLHARLSILSEDVMFFSKWLQYHTTIGCIIMLLHATLLLTVRTPLCLHPPWFCDGLQMQKCQKRKKNTRCDGNSLYMWSKWVWTRTYSRKEESNLLNWEAQRRLSPLSFCAAEQAEHKRLGCSDCSEFLHWKPHSVCLHSHTQLVMLKCWKWTCVFL